MPSGGFIRSSLIREDGRPIDVGEIITDRIPINTREIVLDGRPIYSSVILTSVMLMLLAKEPSQS